LSLETHRNGIKIGLYIYAQRVLSRAQFWISSRPKRTIGLIAATFFTLISKGSCAD